MAHRMNHIDEFGASRGVVAHGLRSERKSFQGAFSGRQGGFASADLFDKLLSLTSKHFSYEYFAVAGCYCLSIEFIVLILYFVLQCFIYFIVSFVSRAMHIISNYSVGGNVSSHSAF